MESEQLRIRTTELLTAACANWGLPKESSGDEEIDISTPGKQDALEMLQNALRFAHTNEEIFLEKGQPAQVTAMRSNLQRINELGDRIDECRKNLAELQSSYLAVTSRTSALHDACDRSMAHQTALASGSEQIRANLHYFKQADLIMKKLSDRGRINVTAPAFSSLLSLLDEGLQFLKAHPEYRESALYIQKYEQCLSKAMTWIRVKVLTDLEACVNSVRKKQAELSVDWSRTDHADEDTRALLYGIFASNAASVRCALGVAEQRFSQVPEFEAMLAECHTAYFQLREQLLVPIIESTLQKLVLSHSDSCCSLTRSGCLFLLGVCGDEFRLFRQFFATELNDNSGSKGRASPAPSVISMRSTAATHNYTLAFEAFSEGLSRILYDVLRPLVVHSPHLETLAELCTILKVEMVEERCLSASADFQASDPFSGFVVVANELVGDVQERIVYRASQYSQSEILGYKPAPGDLAYPEKLVMMRQIEEEQRLKMKESEEQNDEQSTSSAVDLHCLWYPTVRRTVMCLAKLFKCLDFAVFESLARDLLAACCVSLDSAALSIAQMTGTESRRSRTLDSHLFVVKHLLILREQTAPYRSAAARSTDSAFSPKDYSLSLSRVRNSATQFVANMTTDAFLEFLLSVSAPIQVSEVSGDSRRVVDSSLRTRCNQLIDCCAESLVGQFHAFLELADNESKKENFDVKKHPELAAQKFHDMAAEVQRNLAKEWQSIRSSFSLYIGVNDTEAILLQPIKKRIVEVFTLATTVVSRCFTEEEALIAALPSQQHIHLLLNKI
ncbi:unnamed protein product, partial [Mesorhabditis belari]|uniref:Conserved oligomeric Golgi complex subunit 3 n=1 Tax=Mesorhabditis belari TaxID=2138241 RepID=A0AAF3ET47_9BILA